MENGLEKSESQNQTISYRMFQYCWLEMVVPCARVTSLREGDKKKKRRREERRDQEEKAER